MIAVVVFARLVLLVVVVAADVAVRCVSVCVQIANCCNCFAEHASLRFLCFVVLRLLEFAVVFACGHTVGSLSYGHAWLRYMLSTQTSALRQKILRLRVFSNQQTCSSRDPGMLEGGSLN